MRTRPAGAVRIGRGVNADISRWRMVRGLEQLALWLLECFAASSTAWNRPYEPRFWRDWRTDRRLQSLDVEMRDLLASLQAGPVPPGTEP